MEYEIYKAAITICDYFKAKGLAILTVLKFGIMVTYNVCTGLVVARKADESWSLSSATSTFGMGSSGKIRIQNGKLAKPVMKLYTKMWNSQYVNRDFSWCQAKELLDHLESVRANEPFSVKSGQDIMEVIP